MKGLPFTPRPPSPPRPRPLPPIMSGKEKPLTVFFLPLYTLPSPLPSPLSIRIPGSCFYPSALLYIPRQVIIIPIL